MKLKKYLGITKLIKISRIDGCNVKRVASLEFDFYDGACNTYRFEVEHQKLRFEVEIILLCFGQGSKRCHL